MVKACGNICLGYSSRFRNRDILALGDLIDELQLNGLVEEEVVAARTTFAAASAPRPASQTNASTKSKKGKPKKKRPAAASAAFSGVSAAAAAAEDDSSFLGATSSSVFETAEFPLTGITVVTSVERKLESTTITAPSSTASVSTGSTVAREEMTEATVSTGSTVAREEMTEATEALPSLMKKIQTETPPTLMEQIEALQPTTWLNKKDIGFIAAIFNTATELVDSSRVATFLLKLVTKQGGSAEYREGRGSHKLAVLLSDIGKKVLFPFAQHNGRELDRNSRNLIIDGFKELFGFSA